MCTDYVQRTNALVVSLNLARRNLKAGQKAMALAMLYPEPGKGGRGHKGGAKEAKKLGEFSDERLRQARAVFRHSSELAEDVLRDITPLDAAIPAGACAELLAAIRAGIRRKFG